MLHTDFWKISPRYIVSNVWLQHAKTLQVYICEMISTDFQKLNPIYQKYLNRVEAVACANMPHESSKELLELRCRTKYLKKITLLCQMFGCKIVRLVYDFYQFPKYYPIFQQYLNRVMLVHVQTCEMIHLKATNIWTLYQVVQGKKCTRRKRGEINFLLVAEH